MPYPATADNTFERWPAPPRPTVRSGLEGLEILREVPSPLSGLLWTAYRFTTLWITAPPADRPGLADEDAARRWAARVAAEGLPTPLTAPLLGLGAVLGSTGDPPAIAAALRALMMRCWEENWRASAALLGEAAARAAPGDLDIIYDAGRAARRAGWEREAEAWFRHGLSLARRRRNGGEASRYLGSLGNQALRRGNLRLAERLHLRALRAARRSSAHGRAGAAAHDLMLTVAQRGDTAGAERWAAVALDAYGPAHPSVRILVHDLAYLWMERGHFAQAYPLMAALLPHLRAEDGPSELMTLGNLARAAAGAGDTPAFESAWAEVARRHEQYSRRAGWSAALAIALVEAAQGALQIGDPARALWALDRADPLAREATLGRERMVADAVREAAQRALAAPAPVPAPAAARERVPLERIELSDRCVALLTGSPSRD